MVPVVRYQLLKHSIELPPSPGEWNFIWYCHATKGPLHYKQKPQFLSGGPGHSARHPMLHRSLGTWPLPKHMATFASLQLRALGSGLGCWTLEMDIPLWLVRMLNWPTPTRRPLLHSQAAFHLCYSSVPSWSVGQNPAHNHCHPIPVWSPFPSLHPFHCPHLRSHCHGPNQGHCPRTCRFCSVWIQDCYTRRRVCSVFLSLCWTQRVNHCKLEVCLSPLTPESQRVNHCKLEVCLSPLTPESVDWLEQGYVNPPLK